MEQEALDYSGDSSAQKVSSRSLSRCNHADFSMRRRQPDGNGTTSWDLGIQLSEKVCTGEGESLPP